MLKQQLTLFQPYFNVEGDCSISLFRSPLSALALMMGPMQSGLNFTDRIIQYMAK